MSAKVYESVVCPGCGCLCDDIDLAVADDRVVAVSNVCTWGMAKFLGTKKFHRQRQRYRPGRPLLRRGGLTREVSYDRAIRRAADLLSGAQRVLFYGFTHCTYGAQEAGWGLAQRLRARLAPGDDGLVYYYLQGLGRRAGLVATLEEIRDQADFLVFWGCNPIHSCPRLVARHAVFARGRFTERGFEDRRSFAVDVKPTETATFATTITIPPGGDSLLLAALAATPEAMDSGGAATAWLRSKEVQALRQAWRQASYGAMFCGRGLLYGGRPQELFTGIVALSQGTQGPPLAVLPLATDFNAVGLYQVLLREDGALGGALLLDDLQSLDCSQVDVIFCVGGDLWWHLSDVQRRELRRRRIPIITVTAFADHTTSEATVVLPAAIAGVESGGVAYRMDGIPQALAPILPRTRPSEEEIIAGIGAYL